MVMPLDDRITLIKKVESFISNFDNYHKYVSKTPKQLRKSQSLHNLIHLCE